MICDKLFWGMMITTVTAVMITLLLSGSARYVQDKSCLSRAVVSDM